MVRNVATVAVVAVYILCLVFILLANAGYDNVFGLTKKFDTRYEANVPAWLSSALLLCSGLMLAKIWLAKRAVSDRFAPHWLGLSIGFFALSLDETAELHELFFGTLLRRFFASGMLAENWAIIGLVIAAALGAVYARFLMHLSRREMFACILAGALFVGGGGVVELISGFYKEGADSIHLVYMLMTLVEEVLETAGAALFLVTLVTYAVDHAAAHARLLADAAGGKTLPVA
jgi:hypothetical protein